MILMGTGTGNWELGIGSWELGIGNWELGIRALCWKGHAHAMLRNTRSPPPATHAYGNTL